MARATAVSDPKLAILDAATMLMERHGYRKMTIDDIAHEVGIGKATLYGYFENKQEVALAVIERYLGDVLAEWRRIADLDQPAAQTIRMLVSTKVLRAFDQASRYCTSVDDSFSALRTLVLQLRDQHNEAAASILSEVLERGVAEGGLWVVDPRTVAETILVCVSGLMPYSLSPRELTQRDEVERRIHGVVDLILQGLQNPIRSQSATSPQVNSMESK